MSADDRPNYFIILAHLVIEYLLLGGEVITVLARVDLLIILSDSVDRA